MVARKESPPSGGRPERTTNGSLVPVRAGSQKRLDVTDKLYRILEKQDLAPNIYQFQIEAPAVAKKAQAGQFVIVRVDETGERIPLTIADWDRQEGSITIVFNKVGRTTSKLAALHEGDFIANFVGPLGLPAQIDRFGSVVLVVGGYSVATIIPVARALKEAGNRIISVIRAPSVETLFGDERLGSFSERSIVVTSDIRSECDSSIIEPLREVLKSQRIDRVITVGPTCVMRLVAATARQFKIKTVASLNPIMLDGTGMCGVCRVMVAGSTKFACVDGPEFDASEIDWAALMARRCTYTGEPQTVLQYQCRNCAQW